MNGRQRNVTNAQIWGKKNDSNYGGKRTCTSLPVRDLENFRPMDFCSTASDRLTLAPSTARHPYKCYLAPKNKVL